MPTVLGRDRRERDRNVIRATAELLTADIPLDDVFAALCTQLATFIDAPVVYIALRDGAHARVKYLRTDRADQRDPNLLIENEASPALQVLRTGESYVIRNRAEWTPDETSFAINSGAAEQSVSAIYVPLRFGGTNTGVLCVQSPHTDAYTADDLQLIETCALYVAVAVHDSGNSADRGNLEVLATADALTRLPNRRFFDSALENAWEMGLRENRGVSLLFMDIDFFKDFNDNYGHLAGDACLQQVATALASVVKRSEDCVARYGGEEFAAILPNTDHAGAVLIAEKMRHAVLDLAFPHQGSGLKRVSLSIGVATAIPQPDELPQSLIAAADKHVYAAKAAGRNRVYANLYQSASDAVSKRHPNSPHNLPRELTTFFGREAEIGELKGRLKQAPLVTLVGPGGVGKSRLSVKVGSDVLEEFADGVWFIELASLIDAELLPATIASIFHLPETPRQPIVQTLIEYLKDKQLLLIVDNCEHIVDACAELVQRILQEAPAIRIMASSREPLGIIGETVFRIPSFSIPKSIDGLSLADASEFEAIRLFSERAAAVSAFALSEANMETVMSICRSLDGIPLAIEMAAARARMMTVEQIAERLHDRFRILVAGNRTSVPRQQTLRSMIDWSYKLLDAREARFLDRFAVFVNGWTLEAAEVICAEGLAQPWEVLDVLTALVDKSLVVAQPFQNEQRYRLLESTREYAHERLAGSDDFAELQARHTKYYVDIAVSAALLHPTTATKSWILPLDAEEDNFRAALAWTIDQNHDLVLGATLAASLVQYWEEKDRTIEGLRWLRASLERSELHCQQLQGDLWLGVGKLLNASGVYRDSLDASQRALPLFEATGDRGSAAKTKLLIALVTWRFANFEYAKQLTDDALAYYREIGNEEGSAHCLRTLAVLAWQMSDDYETNFPYTMKIYADALAITERLGHDATTGIILGNSAIPCFDTGRFDEAVERCERSIAIYIALNDQTSLAWQRMNLSEYEVARGNYEKASKAMNAALAMFKVVSHSWGMASTLEIAARVSHLQGDSPRAARLIGASNAMYEKMGTQREPGKQRRLDPLIASICERLDARSYEHEVQAGYEMGIEAALLESASVAAS